MNSFSSPQRRIFFFGFLLALFFGYELNIRTFADPDEGRYVEIPREMTVSDDFVTPRLNGLKYFEKPALFYWLQASSIKLFGINETSMRLWPMLFAILGCLAIFYIGAVCYSPPVGIFAASALATNILYYIHSRLVILDLALATLLNLALCCFFLAFVKPPKEKTEQKSLETQNKKNLLKNILITFFYVFCALASLTKGLIGIVLPGLVVFLWILVSKRFSIIKEMLYLPAILLFFAIFVPWHVIVAQKNPDFLYFYFVVEHFLRYTTSLHCRYQPFYFFIPILLIGLFPWTGFVIVAIKNSINKTLKNHLDHAFLMIWFFAIFFFFSFSNSKLIPYIIPVLFPSALVLGIFISEMNTADYKKSVFLSIIMSLILAGIYFGFKHLIANVLENHDAALVIQVFFAFVLLANLILLLPFAKKISKTNAIYIFVFLAMNMMWIFNKASAYYQDIKRPTTKGMAEFVTLNKRPDDFVFCYHRYYQDFPVYLKSTVLLVNFVGELEFGVNAEPQKKVSYSDDEFFKFWKESKKRIWLLASKKDYKGLFANEKFRHNLLNYDGNFVLLSNK